MQERPGLWNQISQGQDADDGTEHFVDAPDDDLEEDGGVPAEHASGTGNGPELSSQAGKQKQTAAGAPHQPAHNGAPPQGGTQRIIGGYDMRKRCIAAPATM